MTFRRDFKYFWSFNTTVHRNTICIYYNRWKRMKICILHNNKKRIALTIKESKRFWKEKFNTCNLFKMLNKEFRLKDFVISFFVITFILAQNCAYKIFLIYNLRFCSLKTIVSCYQFNHVFPVKKYHVERYML